MDNRLSFDVYVKMTNPSCRVELDPFDSWVSVIIGNASIGAPINMLQLWFKEPGTVIDLGKELISAGTKLSKRRAGSTSTIGGSAEQSDLEGNVGNGL